MNKNTTLEKLHLIVQRFLKENNKISMEDKLVDDLGFDSIDIADLVVDIEDTFEIHFSDEELNKLVFVNDIVNLIEKKTNEKSN